MQSDRERESRMEYLEERRRVHERRIARKAAMISNINEQLSFRRRNTSIRYAEELFSKTVERLRRSIDSTRRMIYHIDEEMEQVDQDEYPDR